MKINFNSLTDLDIANICLQRTNILLNYSNEGKYAFDQWHNHSKLSPLLSFVENNPQAKHTIISKWANDMYDDFKNIQEEIPQGIESICDIGCGYGLIDLFLHKEYKCKITLIDIELTKHKKHLFSRDVFSGYSSNISTYNLFIENDITKENITLFNPIINELPKEKMFDLIISTLSLGFHYPVKTYEKFIFDTLKIGGSLIFDYRIDSDNIELFLSKFENIKFIDESNVKFKKIHCDNFLGE